MVAFYYDKNRLISISLDDWDYRDTISESHVDVYRWRHDGMTAYFHQEKRQEKQPVFVAVIQAYPEDGTKVIALRTRGFSREELQSLLVNIKLLDRK